MPGEITETDGVVLHRNPAWHKMGTLAENAPTPREALKLTDPPLDWDVVQRPLFVDVGPESEWPVPEDCKYESIDTHVANFRSDNDELLGVVTKGYVPVSNVDMADFCEALVQESKVLCETVGSVRGGKRVWFLLRGEPFNVARGDEIYPYILVSNGHDGGAAFRVTPTTLRVACINALHAAIPQTDTGELLGAACAYRHTLHIKDRIEDARHALANYGKAIEETKKLADTLAAKDVNSEEVQKFFLECYTADFGEVAINPQNKKEQNARERSQSAYNSFTRRFDDEQPLAGTSLWNAVNAYSGLIQHDRKARGKDDADRVEKRIDSNLFGLGQQRTAAALAVAYRMAQ